MSEFETVAAEMTLSLEGAAVGTIANNLTTEVEGYALDARQGYALDQKKLDVSRVANNLGTIEAGWALDARQGRLLEENKLSAANVFNGLNQTEKGYALDARQGKALHEAKLDKANVANNLTTAGEGYALDARQGKAINDRLNAMKVTQTVTLASGAWTGSGPYHQTVNVSGVTGSNTVIASASPSSFVMYSECMVRCESQGAGTLTFAAQDKPGEALTAHVVVLN